MDGADASQGPAPVPVEFHRSGRDTTGGVTVRRHLFGSWVVLEIEGEMDIAAKIVVSDLDAGGPPFVVFELHGVTFMDAAGLRVMANVRRRAVDAGGCVRVVAPSEQARRLLMLSRSDRLFRVFGSVREAVTTPLGPGDASRQGLSC